MRARIARSLIEWVVGWIDTSYYAWVRQDKGEWSPKVEYVLWNISSSVLAVALPLAKHFDKEAAVDVMVDSGWWG
jgi:hypothetical protein